MKGRLKHWLGNVGLLLGSVIVCLLLLEEVVFRFLLVPDDVLPNVSSNGVLRYAPNTHAVFRHPDGSRTLVTVNEQGWNSTKQQYAHEKPPHRVRVAVIGDSYVHGAFIDVDQGFPEVMEAELKHAGIDAEVYRFGMDGAPLSQYLNMLRREVVPFRPDIVVVQLIHNDFDESYRFIKTRYSSSFLKLEKAADGHVVEIEPAEFRPGSADAFRRFRTFRYLYYETGLNVRASRWVSRFFWGGDEDSAPEFVSSAVDIRKIADDDSNRFFARYSLAEMKALAEREGFELAVAMDGVREAVYAATAPDDFAVGKLNRVAADATRELGLPFLDLQETFTRDYAAHHQHFEFDFDWHWNAYANRLVGITIADWLLADARLALRCDRGRPALERIGRASRAPSVSPGAR